MFRKIVCFSAESEPKVYSGTRAQDTCLKLKTVTRRQEFAATRSLLQRLKRFGIIVNNPTLRKSAISVDAEQIKNFITNGTASSDAPSLKLGRLHIPIQELQEKQQLPSLLKALEEDTRPIAPLDMGHHITAFGRVDEIIKHGKRNVARNLVGQRVSRSAVRAILAPCPKHPGSGVPNLDTIYVPTWAGVTSRFAYFLRYPITKFAQMMAFKVGSWEARVIGVPPAIHKLYGIDFDGDQGFVIPILDYHQATFAAAHTSTHFLLHSPLVLQQPSPTMLLASRMSTRQFTTQLVKKLGEAVAGNNWSAARDWAHSTFASAILAADSSLSAISLYDIVYGTGDVAVMLDTKCTRMSKNHLLQYTDSVGQVDGEISGETHHVAGNYIDGMAIEEFYHANRMGREAVVNSKCGISDWGKLVNNQIFTSVNLTILDDYLVVMGDLLVSPSPLQCAHYTLQCPDEFVDQCATSFLVHHPRRCGACGDWDPTPGPYKYRRVHEYMTIHGLAVVPLLPSIVAAYEKTGGCRWMLQWTNEKLYQLNTLYVGSNPWKNVPFVNEAAMQQALNSKHGTSHSAASSVLFNPCAGGPSMGYFSDGRVESPWTKATDNLIGLTGFCSRDVSLENIALALFRIEPQPQEYYDSNVTLQKILQHIITVGNSPHINTQYATPSFSNVILDRIGAKLNSVEPDVRVDTDNLINNMFVGQGDCAGVFAKPITYDLKNKTF